MKLQQSKISLLKHPNPIGTTHNRLLKAVQQAGEQESVVVVIVVVMVVARYSRSP